MLAKMSLKTTFKEQMLVYLHIPFCDSKCNYCAFNSYTKLNSFKNSYMCALNEQINHNLQKLKNEKITSMFIGGGTPSVIEGAKYEYAFQTLKPYFDKNIQITTEANPNSASLSWLQYMKNLGVNRISFGVQSFFEEKLKFLGRNHTKTHAINAVNNAYKIGFENISIDLMYASVLDSKTSLKTELSIACDLPINHISAYSLTIEKNTAFYGKKNIIKNDVNQAKFIANYIKKRGFEHYEVSNFGKICEHNLGYWKHQSYLGIGAGAVGFDGKSRYYPHKDIKKYIDKPLFCEKENLTKKELNTEKIFLGLRSIVGIKKEILNENQLKKANFLLEQNALTCKDNTFFAKDLFLADELAVYLMD